MTALRIGVNLLYLRPGHVGGSETYVRAMVQHLAALADTDLTLYCDAKAAATFSTGESTDVVALHDAPFAQWRRLWTENVPLGKRCARDEVQVLWSPANFIAPMLPRALPQVATIHDLQHLWFPEHFSFATRGFRERMFRATFARARHTIAISAFTRDDVCSRYGVSSDRITAILEGVDRLETPPADTCERVIGDLGISRPYLLFPAAMMRHKNHGFLVEAFAELVTGLGVDAHLMFTGQRLEPYGSLMDTAARLGVGERVRHLGYVGRQELLSILTGASAMVFPSRFEGFGLPLLEAMQCGTPVIAAPSASIPEIVGSGGLLVPLDDPTAWAEAMRDVLEKPGQSASLIAAGRQNLERFSWHRCALETRDVLAQVAGV